MAGVNKVILLGNLGKDPEVKTTENGTKMARFSLATSETYKDRDGNRQEKTEWHNIVVWRQLAEIAEKYLTKGKTIYLEGKLTTRQWEDKNKEKRYTTEIVADTFTMIGPRKEQDSPVIDSIVEEDLPPAPAPDDDLPF